MLDRKPTESKWQSWLFVVLFALIIFVTIPFARAIQHLVSESVGRSFFLVIVGFVAVLVGYKAIVSARTRELPRSAFIWLGVVGIAFAWYAYALRNNPEEALHLVQYGVLSLLVYRALTHSVQDYSIYVTATLVVGTVGIVDEWIQWLTPNRVWGMRDIQINFTAGALTQLAIVGGLRPGLIEGKPDFASLSVLCRTAAMTLFLFGLTFLNTPDRVSAIASSVPGSSFLMENRKTMIEYGYLYDEPDIGIFKSRFTVDELSELDRLRGQEASSIVDEYIDHEVYRNDQKYRAFLSKYSAARDPYLHEIGVHLFRRNRYLTRTQTEATEAPSLYNVSLRENQFLERYFPTVLRNSSHAWSESTLRHVEREADQSGQYVTRVSEALITRFSEAQALAWLSIGVVGLTLISVFFTRSKNSAREGPGEDQEKQS